jgi:hypothetical protein
LEAELQGGLVGGQPEVGEQVADPLLGGVDDLAGGGGVDGGGDIGAELLEAPAQLVEQVLGRELGLVVHGGPSSGDRRHVFGLGEEGKPGRLTVTWRNQSKQHFDGLSADRYYRITQGQAQAEALPARH